MKCHRSDLGGLPSAAAVTPTVHNVQASSQTQPHKEQNDAGRAPVSKPAPALQAGKNSQAAVEVDVTSVSFTETFREQESLPGKSARKLQLEPGYMSFHVSALDDNLVTCGSLPSELDEQLCSVRAHMR